MQGLLPLAKAEAALSRSREALALALRKHPDAQIRNLEWTHIDTRHTAALCDCVAAILRAFPDRKVLIVLEAEIARLGHRARPEDFIAWIEDVGIFVVEVKSHRIDGISGFEGGIPQVIYGGHSKGDKDLLEQPCTFAYALRAELERQLDSPGNELPALYYAGWLPYVSPSDVQRRGAEVRLDRIWLSDMLDRDAFLRRLGRMKNLTGGRGAHRKHLPDFSNSFGCTSGLRVMGRPRPSAVGSLAQTIHERERLIAVLTSEQERLAFNPNLVRGPKVVRGVVGSGKTVVLANAIAEQYLRHLTQCNQGDLFEGAGAAPRILTLCFNKALVPYISSLIQQCFQQRKPDRAWEIPKGALEVVHIDGFASRLCGGPVRYDTKRPKDELVKQLLEAGRVPCHSYDHIFVDEGQDLDLGWYPLLRGIARTTPEGPSIIVFYDEAQNVYGALRPGSGPGVPTWTDLLGAVPNPRGLPTVMRVGHRNTNEVLSFSFSMLLGAFAKTDPQMAVFTNLAEYKHEIIPDEPQLNHPNAGKPCVEEIGPRQYRVNFAVHSGALPSIYREKDREALARKLAARIRSEIETGGAAPEDVLVLCSRRQSVLLLFRALEREGLRCHSPLNFGKDDPRAGRLSPAILSVIDFRSEPLRQPDCVTVSTIKSAKGYSAPLVHVAFPEELEGEGPAGQRGRAEFHVACTRATTELSIWGTGGSLLAEAEDARAAPPLEGRLSPRDVKPI